MRGNLRAASACVAALSVLLAPRLLRADESSDFDAFEGIDRNGRIEAAERPADMSHPERWRYIPEGRLKPGNVLQRFLVSSFISPLFSQHQDTGTGGGFAVVDIDFRNQRRREFAAIFASLTSRGQQRYSMLWQRWLNHLEAPGGGVFQEERSRVIAFGGYSKTLTRRFFGIGPGTRSGMESSYTDELWEAEVGIDRAWPDPGDDFVIHLGLRYAHHDLSDGRSAFSMLDPRIRPGGQLNDTPIGPFFGTDFGAVLIADKLHDAGVISLGLRLDTRDGQINPYDGWVLSGQADAALWQTGGDVGALFTLKGSRVIPVPAPFHHGGDAGEEHPPTDTVALQLMTQLTAGEVPFFDLPTLGGAAGLRGFVEGRFRDRASWFFVAEWRPWVLPRGFRIPFSETLRVERVGVAFFYEVGAVGGDGAALFESKPRQSYGLGLRITLERQALFRVDLGFSSEETATVSAGFGLNF